MANASSFWKRSVGSDTASKGDGFASASLRLALIYLALTVALVIAVSAVFYLALARNLADEGEDEFASPVRQARFVEQAAHNLRVEILTVDTGLLVLLAGGSVLLARRTLRPVQGAIDAQKMFVSNASHELRTPLGILKAEYQVAARAGKAPEDFGAFLSDGLQEIDRMSRIVSDLLTLSRIDAHEERLSVATVNVGATLERTGERLRPLAEHRLVAIVHDQAVAVEVKGDEDKLEHALLNVLKNAIEHSPQGGTVCVRLRHKGRRAEIEIEDGGDGIAPDDLPHVFERFYRAGRPHFEGSSGGNGLGLSIAQWIIHAHRGTIDVASAPQAGTTVTIFLPASS